MDDLLDSMRRNPAADWTMNDVARICGQHRVRCTPPTGGGSHYKMSHPSRREILTISRAKPVKPVNIRKLVKFIEALGRADA